MDTNDTNDTEDKETIEAREAYVKTLRDMGASEVVIAAAEGRIGDMRRLMKLERQRWRLNAPRDYNWNDEDVLFEKKQSVLNGIMVGIAIGALMAFACMTFLAR